MSEYFSYLPNFEYINRGPNDQQITEYTKVKNLFKRVKFSNDLFQDLTSYTKYKIIGDERPDNVANKIYGSAVYDWIVLLSNNIINIEEEWPLSQLSFENYMLRKYGEENYNSVHHYETIQVKNRKGDVIVPKGLEVPSTYTVKYFDSVGSEMITRDNITLSVTNNEYENKIQDQKRNIFLIRPNLIQEVINQVTKFMEYDEGSTQYVSENLVRGEDSNLYS
jgi:hypothetical protein